MNIQIEHIDPDKALAMLVANTCNRNLRKNHVHALANAMRRGEWAASHQGIAISESGVLLDGQHRLTAIIESGIGIDIAVARNVPDAAKIAMDIGAKRSISDVTGIHPRISQALYFAVKIVENSNVASPSQVEKMYCKIGSNIERLVDYCGSTKGYFSTAPVKVAAIVQTLDGKKESSVFASYRRLCLCDTEHMLPSEHAIYRQVSSGKVKAGGEAGQRDQFARMMRVFANPPISKIQINEDSVRIALEKARKLLLTE